MQKLLNSINIGIIGLGLIGGSIYKCFAKAGLKIFACSSNTETINAINSDNNIAGKNITILKDCDIVFVCTPISETVRTIKSVFEINSDAIIADVASLKYDILSELEKIDGCKFIGTHPMAGTENSGFNSSFAQLFQGAKWVLTPSKNISKEDTELIEDLISLTGANIVYMNAKKHDEAVALISHLPMLLSQSLINTVQDNNSALLLASSGFRDTTRLAMSNKLMANDMLTLNKKNIKTALENVITNANNLLNSGYFQNNIDKIINVRKDLYDAEGKNSFGQ